MSVFRHVKHHNQQYIQYKEEKKPVDSSYIKLHSIFSIYLKYCPPNPTSYVLKELEKQ